MTAVLYGLAALGAFTLGCWVALGAWFGVAWATEAYRGRRSRRVEEQENALAVREAERMVRSRPRATSEDER